MSRFPMTALTIALAAAPSALATDVAELHAALAQSKKSGKPLVAVVGDHG